LDDSDLDLENEGKTLKNRLTELASRLNVNITTEINGYIDSIESAAEGLENDLSSATGGMKLKDA